MLKPQDTLLAMKYWSLNRSGIYLPVRQLGEAIGISASEASKGAKRLISARLLVERDKAFYVETNAFQEWLSYGVRYAYPIQSPGFGRGMPTAWNCPLITGAVLPPSPPMVWSQPGGGLEGVFVEPIHSTVSLAASNDDLLYQLAALVDAVRLGKPRELVIARDLLGKWIKGIYE